MGADTLLLRDRPEELAAPRFAGLTPSSYLEFATLDAYAGVATSTLRGVVASELESIRRAAQLGVRLHVGTDAPTRSAFMARRCIGNSSASSKRGSRRSKHYASPRWMRRSPLAARTLAAWMQERPPTSCCWTVTLSRTSGIRAVFGASLEEVGCSTRIGCSRPRVDSEQHL